MHFSLFWPRENWGGRKKVRGGGGERRQRNACPQTPRFWKTRSSTNGASWLARHGSVDCQVINPSIKSVMFIELDPHEHNELVLDIGEFFSLSLFLPEVPLKIIFVLIRRQISKTCGKLFPTRGKLQIMPLNFEFFEHKNCTGIRSWNSSKFWTTFTPTALQSGNCSIRVLSLRRFETVFRRK